MISPVPTSVVLAAMLGRISAHVAGRRAYAIKRVLEGPSDRIELCLQLHEEPGPTCFLLWLIRIATSLNPLLPPPSNIHTLLARHFELLLK